MKKLILFTFVIIAATAFQSKGAIEYGNEGYFYTALQPYGQWVELNDGVTAWQPDIAVRNWAPYTIGRWEWTADGWYWDSDEPFGYITYHYGRWYNDDYYGWIWVPDDQWAPAWVEWRYDDDYVGWAPLSPYGVFTIGVGLHFSHEYHAPYGYWNFVTYNHFCDRNVYNYYAGPTYKYRIYNGTKFRTDYDYSNGRVINRGVGYDIIRQRGGRPIKTREIVRETDPRQVIGNRDRSVIRTYIATRNDITRDNVRDINFKKTDRKTTLETSRVTIGARSVGTNNNSGDRLNPAYNNRTIQTSVQQQSLQQNNQRQIEAQRQQQVDQQNRQNQQQQIQERQNTDQQNRLRQQQIDQQNRQNQQQQIQQRHNADQLNRQRQQQIDQQNRQRQQQQIQQNRQNQQQQIQQNRQSQQIEQRQSGIQEQRQRQQVDQQNRQRQQQQVQQRQKVEQQPRQRQQTEQRQQRTEQKSDSKDKGRDRR
jgi:hypothetical protein